jgi:hypothetical protein
MEEARPWLWGTRGGLVGYAGVGTHHSSGLPCLTA